MADIDDINVCGKCLHPVDSLIVCPDCERPVEKMPSLLLQTLRILRLKGWIVEKWEQRDDADVRLKLTFYLFAPPSYPDVIARWPRSSIVVELENLKPSILALGDSLFHESKNLYDWAVRVPNFALPFGQDLCDLCRQQAGDWYFSLCNCPVVKGWIQFARGIPERCVYADAQVVTKEVRLKQLELFFRMNPIAKRKLREEFPPYEEGTVNAKAGCVQVPVG